MPPYPDGARGRLTAVSAGPGGSEEIKGAWSAEAGLCDTPPMLLVEVEEPSAGTILLLALPSANRITAYPVTAVQAGLPTPPGAQLGVQLFRRTGAFTYQGTDGTVEVSALEETVSGRFAVTMREISTNTRLRYAGSFRGIPVRKLDAKLCAPAVQGAR